MASRMARPFVRLLVFDRLQCVSSRDAGSKLQLLSMVLWQAQPLTDRDESDVSCFRGGEKLPLLVDGNSGGALVQDGEAWPVVEDSSHPLTEAKTRN